MADPILLDALRDQCDRARVESIRETVFNAYLSRLENVSVIIGKSSEADSANAQVVVNRDDYRDWLAATKMRLDELDADVAGEGALLEGTRHVNFSERYVAS